MLFHRLWTSCFFNPFANIFGEQWLRLTCLFVPTQVIGFPAFLEFFVAALPCIIFFTEWYGFYDHITVAPWEDTFWMVWFLWSYHGWSMRRYLLNGMVFMIISGLLHEKIPFEWYGFYDHIRVAPWEDTFWMVWFLWSYHGCSMRRYL